MRRFQFVYLAANYRENLLKNQKSFKLSLYNKLFPEEYACIYFLTLRVLLSLLNGLRGRLNVSERKVRTPWNKEELALWSTPKIVRNGRKSRKQTFLAFIQANKTSNF